MITDFLLSHNTSDLFSLKEILENSDIKIYN